jgi:hypothetical protein
MNSNKQVIRAEKGVRIRKRELKYDFGELKKVNIDTLFWPIPEVKLIAGADMDRKRRDKANSFQAQIKSHANRWAEYYEKPYKFKSQQTFNSRGEKGVLLWRIK